MRLAPSPLLAGPQRTFWNHYVREAYQRDHRRQAALSAILVNLVTAHAGLEQALRLHEALKAGRA